MKHLFLGVDVSKNSLTVYDGQRTYTFPNQRRLKHFHRFLKKYYRRKEKQPVIIYEPTGPYSAFLEEFCAWKKLHVVRLNPRKVPYLLEVLGQRSKTDRLDAKALYAYSKLLKPFEIQLCKLDQRKERLASLLSDYFFLRQQETTFANHLEALERNPFSSPKSVEFVRKELHSLREQIKALWKEMYELAREEEEIGKTVEKMKEIVGVGFLTALGLGLLFGRRKVRRREEVVALLGLDPLVRQSGKSEGARRISRRGDQRLRALLYMAALCAIRANAEIREFYQRLRERGKPGKVAVVACMRKLALLCWAHYKMVHGPSTP